MFLYTLTFPLYPYFTRAFASGARCEIADIPECPDRNLGNFFRDLTLDITAIAIEVCYDVGLVWVNSSVG